MEAAWYILQPVSYQDYDGEWKESIIESIAGSYIKI